MKHLSSQALSFIIWKLNLPRDLKSLNQGGTDHGVGSN